VSREEIVHEAARFGAPEEGLRRALLKPPGLWDRFNHERRRYLAFMQAALSERVRSGRVVYHGNAGHLLLPGITHVVCVRLIAPLEFRVRMLHQRSGMTEDEALDHLHEVDGQREKWTRFLYGVDWLDPHLYDLSINLRTLEVEDAVDLVAVLAAAAKFQPTEESLRSLDDLVLASRVRAALAADPGTASVEVKVHVDGGTVVLAGRLRSPTLVDAAIGVAGQVEGVSKVDRDNLDAPDFTV
jgi:cytidylate kinase